MLTRTDKATRIRMCEADRDAYGGPEWVTFDPDALAELPGSKLEAIETATGFRIAWFYVPTMRISARGQRAALWIARHLAGLVDAWDDFDPRILLADTELVATGAAGDAGDGQGPAGAKAGDAGPPAAGSAAGSTGGP